MYGNDQVPSFPNAVYDVLLDVPWQKMLIQHQKNQQINVSHVAGHLRIHPNIPCRKGKVGGLGVGSQTTSCFLGTILKDDSTLPNQLCLTFFQHCRVEKKGVGRSQVNRILPPMSKHQSSLEQNKVLSLKSTFQGCRFGR